MSRGREVVAPGEVHPGARRRNALGQASRLENLVVGPGVAERRVPGAAQESGLPEQRRDPAPGLLAPAVLALVARAEVVVPHAMPGACVGFQLVAAEASGRGLELARRRVGPAAGHEVHGRAERVPAEQHRRPVHHLHPLHVLERQQVEIHFVGVRLVGAHAVHVHRHALRQPDHGRHLEAAQRDVQLSRGAELIGRGDAGELLQRVGERAHAPGVQVARVERRRPPGEPAGDLADGGEPDAGDDHRSEGTAVFGEGVGVLCADGRREQAEQHSASQQVRNAECGVRSVRASVERGGCGSTRTIQLRIPHSALRIPHSALRTQLKAFNPVISCPSMSVWMSCVPSYVYTDSRFAR